MDYSASYAAASREQTLTLFGRVMWLVAIATGFFALGCYAGRDLSAGWSIAWFILAYAIVSLLATSMLKDYTNKDISGD